MLLWWLFFIVFMAPAFAAYQQRAADRRAEKLVERVRADLAAGRTTPDAPPPKKLALWPYAILGILLASVWALASTNAAPGETSTTGGSLIGMGVIAATLVWLPFHIFIFVKRTSTGVSLLVFAAMIACAAGLAYATQTSPFLADLAQRLN